MHLEVSNRLGVEFPQLLRCSSKFRRPAHPTRGSHSSPELLAPDSTYFYEPMGINPMLERGHESVRRAGLSSDIQDAIGQRLRAEYALERSMPARLANLLKEFEQRNDKAEAFARDGYASAA